MPKKKSRKSRKSKSRNTLFPVDRRVQPVIHFTAQQRRDALAVRRRHWQAILRRTAASRAQIDHVIAGADMSDVADLPIVTGLPDRPSTPPKTRRKKKTVAPLGISAVADDDFLRRMAKAPPKPKKKRRRPPITPTADAPARPAVPAPA